MASADYSVGTKVTADVSNFEKGMNKAEKSLKGFSEKLANSIDRLGKKGLVGSIANVTLAMQGLTKSFSTVIKFAQDVGKAINECTEAYKGQVIAERALDNAIQNNPFVTGESSKALKEFASDMQRVSNYGDEELIPMMANLISLGRTESETMQIMSVAMDMSAGMGISLDSAITQLNATLNGNIGRLGQQNAELKGLTEEELKQGKAVEILGEKFKGFASATADTSKQLQNIKGDFKEALGQFTLPSSDMWNKFWSGFYEKGIEIINKLDAYMDAETLGKKLSKALEEQVKKIKNEGEKGSYLRGALDLVTDSELQYLNDYLSGLRKVNKDQQKILEFVQKEQEARKFVAEEQARFAKLKADRLKQEEEEKRLAEERAKREKELAEEKAKKEKELAETREKQLKIQREWEDKLFSIRIENLEKQRELELKNEELTEEQKEDISKFYGEQILAMRLQQIEKNRKEALNAENVTEEARLAINLYYDNEITQAKKEEEKKRHKAKKEELEEEEKEERKILSAIIKIAQEATKKIGDNFKKVADTVKNVFSKIKSIFKGALDIFKFNPDDALNSLLAIEDAILTFFVETLPKLPSFFSSAIQSIITLIHTLLNAIDWDKVQEVINSVIDIIVENAPQIVNDLVDLVIHIAQTLLNAIIHFVESGGWKTLLDLLLDIQKKIENFFIENIDEIVNTIEDMIPDLIEFLKNSIVSASKTLGKLAPKILPLIADLINAIIEVITSDEVLESFFDALEGIVEGLIVAIIKLFTKGVPKLLNFAIKLASPQNLMKIVVAIVKGLVKAFAQINWGEVVKDIFTAFIDGIKELFGIHSPSTLFEEFGTYMVEGLVNGLKGIAEAVMIILQPLINAIQSLFSGLFSFISDVIGKILNAVTSINQMSFDALEKVIGGLIDSIGKISDSLTAITEISFDALNASIGTVTDSLTKITEMSFGAISDLANISFETLKTTLNSISDVLKTISSTAVDLVDVSFKGLKDVIDAIGSSVTNMTNSVTDLVNALTDLVEAVNKGTSALNPFSGGGGSSGGGEDREWYKKAVDPFNWFWHANGTNNAPAGLSVVGEAGPELVKFRGGEQVLNAHNTQKALEGMGGTVVNQNVTFNNLQDTTAFTMIQQLKQYNRQLAINGIV